VFTLTVLFAFAPGGHRHILLANFRPTGPPFATVGVRIPNFILCFPSQKFHRPYATPFIWFMNNEFGVSIHFSKESSAVASPTTVNSQCISIQWTLNNDCRRLHCVCLACYFRFRLNGIKTVPCGLVPQLFCSLSGCVYVCVASKWLFCHIKIHRFSQESTLFQVPDVGKVTSSSKSHSGSKCQSCGHCWLLTPASYSLCASHHSMDWCQRSDWWKWGGDKKTRKIRTRAHHFRVHTHCGIPALTVPSRCNLKTFI
jgi:hypothetical protein